MLICPICQAPLASADNGLACANRHSFDRARQGYLNLLPVQHKKSLDPGDNAAMVEARRRFLGAGHYAPLAARLAELAVRRAPGRWIDIGCGEGQFTHFCAKMGAEVVFGEARFEDDHAVTVDGRRVSADRWLIATGSSPAVPLTPGLREAGFLTNRELFSLERLPASLAILGAGPVAVESCHTPSRMISNKADSRPARKESEAFMVMPLSHARLMAKPSR